jgi:hypothetical protein
MTSKPSVTAIALGTCEDCGNNLTLTGQTKMARSRRPAFNCYVAQPIRLIEYECDACGLTGWCEDGAV